MIIEKAHQCIDYIVNHAKSLGCKVQDSLRNKKKFHESEVTVSTVKKTHIEKINEKIEEYETLLKTEFTKEIANVLQEEYQQAIEYYSALGDEKYITYLEKMKGIIKMIDESEGIKQ